ncbi:DUF5752 family protein [Acidianus manzaensis]|uniref:Uncharacterized protein n=1 Tax=Acidianus manzaensis TaxID=282676 RepID=A0A1W6JXJ3_9CREN|nr:DUF5752 family protein [Acidianus manzaensis]ARM74950.1 hypothetical protein B6F84_02175 [Acidianus manzaensis]
MDLDSKGKGIPFKFYAAYYPPVYTKFKANNITELIRGIANVDKFSIFYHVFHPMLSSHVVPEDLPNDFAFWLRESLHDEYLAEVVADVEGGEPLQIEDIRKEIIELLNTSTTEKVADYPFVFISCQPIIYPLNIEARTLAEFIDAIGRVPARSLFYHFVYRRVMGESKRNEFTLWLEENFGLIDLGEKLSTIDPQSYTDEEKFRTDLLNLFEEELLR